MNRAGACSRGANVPVCVRRDHTSVRIVPRMPSDLASLDAAETAFQQALLANDIAALDDMLHDQVRFVGPDGVTINKRQDIDAHRRGELVFSAVDQLERDTQVIDSVGITRAELRLVGTVAGDPVDVTLVYTRTWLPSAAGWLIVAAHGSAKAGEQQGVAAVR